MERQSTFNASINIINSSWEELQREICFKNSFSDRIFYVTIFDIDNERQKSLHTLFDKYLDHMLVNFEQNRTIWTAHFFFFGKKVHLFSQSIDAILEDVSVTEIIIFYVNQLI